MAVGVGVREAISQFNTLERPVVWLPGDNDWTDCHRRDAPGRSRSSDGYTAVVDELRQQTLGFGGQVVLVHGDSHDFKVDKPLLSPTGKVLANLMRLRVAARIAIRQRR